MYWVQLLARLCRRDSLRGQPAHESSSRWPSAHLKHSAVLLYKVACFSRHLRWRLRRHFASEHNSRCRQVIFKRSIAFFVCCRKQLSYSFREICFYVFPGCCKIHVVDCNWNERPQLVPPPLFIILELNFVRRRTVLVGPQNGTCFKASIWCLKLWRGSYIFGKVCGFWFRYRCKGNVKLGFT